MKSDFCLFSLFLCKISIQFCKNSLFKMKHLGILLFFVFLSSSVKILRQQFFNFLHFQRFSFQVAFLKIDKIEVKYNSNIVKVTMNLDNSEWNQTSVNWTANLVSDKMTTKFLQLVTVSIAEDSNDREYRRVLLKTTIDLCRLAQVQSTFFAKAFMENFLSASNYQLRFHFLFFWCYRNDLILLQLPVHAEKFNAHKLRVKFLKFFEFSLLSFRFQHI